MLQLEEYLQCVEARNRTKADVTRDHNKLIKSFKQFLKDHDDVSTVLVHGVIEKK